MTLDQIIEKTNLLECIDGAYQERGDWRPIIESFYRSVVLAERERCAQVCLDIENEAWQMWMTNYDTVDNGASIGASACADAIREDPSLDKLQKT